jgi:hypothetical protein
MYKALIIILLFPFFSFSQDFKFGIELGPSVNFLRGSYQPYYTYKPDDTKRLYTSNNHCWNVVKNDNNEFVLIDLMHDHCGHEICDEDKSKLFDSNHSENYYMPNIPLNNLEFTVNKLKRTFVYDFGSNLRNLSPRHSRPFPLPPGSTPPPPAPAPGHLYPQPQGFVLPRHLRPLPLPQDLAGRPDSVPLPPDLAGRPDSVPLPPGSIPSLPPPGSTPPGPLNSL